MIACVERPGALPHLVRWIGQKRLLSVAAITYCRVEFDASEGVSQLPDDTKICAACDANLKKEVYPKR